MDDQNKLLIWDPLLKTALLIYLHLTLYKIKEIMTLMDQHSTNKRQRQSDQMTLMVLVQSLFLPQIFHITMHTVHLKILKEQHLVRL